jgi:hypothetical protein
MEPSIFNLYFDCQRVLKDYGFIFNEALDTWVCIYNAQSKKRYEIKLSLEMVEYDYLVIFYQCKRLNEFPLCVEDLDQFTAFCESVWTLNQVYSVT